MTLGLTITEVEESSHLLVNERLADHDEKDHVGVTHAEEGCACQRQRIIGLPGDGPHGESPWGQGRACFGSRVRVSA